MEVTSVLKKQQQKTKGILFKLLFTLSLGFVLESDDHVLYLFTPINIIHNRRYRKCKIKKYIA